MALLTVYDLRQDHQRVSWVQEATRITKDLGLEPTHGLFGSAEWWRNIESKRLPLIQVSGIVTDIYSVGEAEHPEFTMVDEAGIESSWTREANRIEDDDLYVIGRRVEVDYVLQRRRLDLTDLGIDLTEKSLVSVRIDVSRSRAYRYRSSLRYSDEAELERPRMI
ncbi:MAG TPA: hypothetical protein VIB38_09175 [Aestuariivirgaceae bacterium]|jgi:hypothetical protein